MVGCEVAGEQHREENSAGEIPQHGLRMKEHYGGSTGRQGLQFTSETAVRSRNNTGRAGATCGSEEGRPAQCGRATASNGTAIASSAHAQGSSGDAWCRTQVATRHMKKKGRLDQRKIDYVLDGRRNMKGIPASGTHGGKIVQVRASLWTQTVSFVIK